MESCNICPDYFNNLILLFLKRFIFLLGGSALCSPRLCGLSSKVEFTTQVVTIQIDHIVHNIMCYCFFFFYVLESNGYTLCFGFVIS